MLSTRMGRRPSPNPKNAHVAFRADEKLTEMIDAEVARRKKKGGLVDLTRSQVVRSLVYDALRKK
jgi:hypothetical protein